MNRRTIITLSAIATFAWTTLSIGHSSDAAEPTLSGTWDLNVAKSKSTDPMPKSITRTYKVKKNVEDMTGTIVTAGGKTVPIGFTAAVDGKDYPFQSPGFDSLALTRVDTLTVSFVSKLSGKPVVTGTRALSQDGKTLTFKQKGINAAGAPLESTMIYDKR